ncbi:MAG: carbohydrate porin [Gammaproteobacteria bacterium]|nr:carbohydrate porin [Gammaproteobacteria bacterium]
MSCNIASANTPTHEEEDSPIHIPFPFTTSDSPFVFGLQSTYINQHKNAFSAPYTGQNSLLAKSENSYTYTATALLGAHLWSGGELYINPEIYQAVGFSGLTGLAGPVDGEQQKGGKSNGLNQYIARAFLKQTWNLGGDDVELTPSLTQFADTAKSQRIVVTAGLMSITDIFNTATATGDPRENFMNWSFMTYGAYDYTGDTRGYTRGLAIEYYNDDWALRYGRFLIPKQSNSAALDDHIFDHFGEQIELEHNHKFDDLAGSIKVLAYRNVANMGDYRTSINQAIAANTTPDISTSRADHTKLGLGIHAEQSITPNLSLFTQLSTNNGKYEEWTFAEIDRQAQFGLSGNGKPWGRNDDNYGIGYVINGLSNSHKDYLQNGGLGAFLGDGTLRYHTENTLEAYYSFALPYHFQLAFDYQNITNPGYNADRRGSVNVFGMRLHFEYF